MSKTYTEMKAQYAALNRTAEYIQNRINIIGRYLNEGQCRIMAFLGSGSSYSVAKSCEAIYRDMNCGAAASYASGDVMLNAERYAEALDNGVIVAITRSGSTSEVLNAIAEVKKRATVRVIAITCVEDSPIKDIADLTLELPWAFDESVCQTRTVSNMYLAGAMIAVGIAGKSVVLRRIEESVAKLEAYSNSIEATFLSLAKERWDSAVVLADGEMAGIAEEGALAFKEICQVPSNSYGLLDCRHGPMVVMGKGTLIIACAVKDGEYERKLIADLTAKHATVVTFTDLPAEFPNTYSNFSFGQELDPIVRAIALLIICQYASYYKALVKGLNPDAPAGLDAWIKL
ncbi:MAG: SIS domain-containing protein [Clostridia bacterium]|nr:SIS domain-containing protein [Clostridia bacterium]